MTEKQDITVRVMPEIEDRVVELSNKLESLMVERAPEAWQAALAVVQIEGAATIVLGLVLLIAGLLLLRLWGRPCLNAWNSHMTTDWAPAIAIGGLCALIGGCIMSVIGAVLLADIWAYVAFAAPELVIARKLMAGLL